MTKVQLPKGEVYTTCIDCGMYLGYMKETNDVVHLNMKRQFAASSHDPNPQNPKALHEGKINE